jgi:hypothetical protein
LFDNPEYKGIIKEIKDMSEKKSGRDSPANKSLSRFSTALAHLTSKNTI